MMWGRRVAATAVLLPFMARTAAQQVSFVTEQNSFNPITPEIKRFADELLKNATIPGLSLAVVHLNGSFDSASFGVRTEEGDGMTTNTMFGIASCSKAFLASSFGILIDDFAQGRNVTPLPEGVTTLNWRTKVKDVLPDDWELQDKWTTEKADFRDLFSHQSGFPRHDLSYQPTDTPLDVIRRQRLLRPAFELRQRYHYNNQMYMLGSHVISILSGMPYTEFVKQRIFDPLNMTHTVFSPSEASAKGLLTQSWTTFGRRIPYWFGEESVPLVAGPMGIISNALDLAKWVRTLLNDGVDPVTNATIVPASAIRAQTFAHIIIDPSPTFPDSSLSGYGHGWIRHSYQGYEILSHPGAIPGFSDYIYLLPSHKLGIVILGNADGKHAEEAALAFRIIDNYLGVSKSKIDGYADGHTAGGQLPVNSGTSPASFVPGVQVHSGETVIPLEDYVGVYRSPGYPDIILCHPHARRIPSPHSNSIASHIQRQCEDTLSVYSALENVTATTDTLYFAFLGLWVSHGRLTRASPSSSTHLSHLPNSLIPENDYDCEGHAGSFEFTATYLFPHGFGKNKTAFESAVTGETRAKVQFATGYCGEGNAGVNGEVSCTAPEQASSKVKGFGLFGLVGEETESQRNHDVKSNCASALRERAEVWFDRIDSQK